jgi:uncharacterized protein YciI
VAPKPPPVAAKPPPSKLFAVTLSRGPAWNADVSMEMQADWEAHAALMDAMDAEGFIFIGGPLDDTPYVLLAVRAEDPMEIRARLDTDPWHVNRLLEISRIAPWTLRLGAGKI